MSIDMSTMIFDAAIQQFAIGSNQAGLDLIREWLVINNKEITNNMEKTMMEAEYMFLHDFNHVGLFLVTSIVSAVM